MRWQGAVASPAGFYARQTDQAPGVVTGAVEEDVFNCLCPPPAFTAGQLVWYPTEASQQFRPIISVRMRKWAVAPALVTLS